MRYLLDTNVVSNPVSRRPSVRTLRMLESHGAACAVPAPVWHELLFGCERLPRGKRRLEIEEYFRTVVAPAYPVFSYDESAAAIHAAERARLEAAGRAMPFVDGQIAAIAVANDLVLVTENARDFRGFRGLEIEDWS